MTNISVMGGSGYAGGELLRLLFAHPDVQIQLITSRQHAGDPVYRLHPNLRGVTSLRFVEPDLKAVAAKSDLVFTSVPHTKSSDVVAFLMSSGIKVIDLGADFRLKNPEDYKAYYGSDHTHPELLDSAVYGLPEFHREEIRKARLVAVPGCMATASIIPIAPLLFDALVDPARIVVDAKIGSSGAGMSATQASHHSERSGGVRPYKATGHRHIAEIEQELRSVAGKDVTISFTPHAVNMVRGILATSHLFANADITDQMVWKSYRGKYGHEPFVRMVSDKKGLYGLPNPKITTGTNYCDVGFEVDRHAQRVVSFSAIDNLTKGAAGQAVQCFNIMSNLDEKTGLNALALHPQ